MTRSVCIENKLRELKGILERSGTGQMRLLKGPITSPFSLSHYTGVWDNKGAAVMAHMPSRDRLQYAQLYDEFRKSDQIKTEESEVWGELAQFDEPGALDVNARRRLRELRSRAVGANYVIEGNYSPILALGDQLGIDPQDPAGLPSLPHNKLCDPILPQAPAG